MRKDSWKVVPGVLGLLMVLISATLAIVTVSEIAARDSFAAFLRQYADSLRAEYFQATRTRAPAAGSGDAISNVKELNLANEIDEIRIFEQQVRILSSLGAGNDAQTLESVRRKFEKYRNNRDNLASLDRLNNELSVAEALVAATNNRIAAAEADIRSASEQMKKSSDEASARRADYSRLVKDRDIIATELATLMARLDHLSRAAVEVERPEVELKVAGLKQRRASLEDQLLRAQKEAGFAVPTSMGVPTNLRTQLSTDKEKLPQLVAAVEKIKVKLKQHNVEGTNSAEVSLTLFPRLHSDYLLALSIIACSVLGALIAGLRAQESTSLRDMTLGIASGFVCYFAIKGGKYVFFLSTSMDYVSFNPYGSAFAGLLVGLFSERVYNLLTTLVGDLEKRLQLAVSLNDPTPPNDPTGRAIRLNESRPMNDRVLRSPGDAGSPSMEALPPIRPA